VTVIQRRIFLSVLACAVLGMPVRAQEADLTWKFKKDAVFYQEMKTETVQDMKVAGSTDVKQTQNQTFFFSWTPTEIDDKKKEVTLKQKIIGLKMSIEIGGSKIAYDSTEPQAAAGTANPLNKFFEALKDAEFKLTLDTDKMTVKSITGHTEFVNKLGQANPQMKPLLDKILSEKALKDMAEPMFAALPGVKKKKGESWDKTSDLDMGPIGSYKTKYTYTYDGPDAKQNQVIKVKTDLTYKAPADAGGGLPFRIKSADLKATDGTGDIVYDAKAGYVASQKMSLTLKGSLAIEIGQQTTDVTLDQKQTTTITTTDKNPVEPKK
jgi:hypothetical protein